jgi:putative FmdB family regulatory protein
MPIFEYACSKCGHQFEALVRPQGDSPQCPECQSTKLDRLISTFAIDSDNTRKANLAAGRKFYAPQRKEKKMEQIKYEQKVMRGED